MSDISVAIKRADEAMLAEVAQGLACSQKEISPKYFYDHRGSELFEEITRLPEYYLTRTERALLQRVAPTIATSLRPASVVELGAGSAEKTRILLDALGAASLTYVPVDVSAGFLEETAARMRASYPGLRVTPVVADLNDFVIPRSVPRPSLIAFLGSTIGNFDDDAAVRLLARVRMGMRSEDRLLLGADLVKDVGVIEAAYNDAQGVTAEFNRNMLRVLNHELGATFDPDAFEHWAFFNAAAGRIEMHLVADADQCVHIPGVGEVAIGRGESIRTEISNKYDRPRLTRLLGAAHLAIEGWETDDRGGYALVIARPSA
jgi:L-histidine Nalpha-methyltransferase